MALGMVAAAGGRWREAVLGSVNYGRDADSIAGMAGAIAGALEGAEAIPSEWEAQVSEAGRIDLAGLAAELTAVAEEMFARDRDRWAQRAARFPPH